MLFSTDKPFVWDMERAYRAHGDVVQQPEGSATESEEDKGDLVHGEHV